MAPSEEVGSEDQHKASFSVKLESRDTYVDVDHEPADLSVDGGADRAIINAVSGSDRYATIGLTPTRARELADVLLTYADNAESGRLQEGSTYHWEVAPDE